MAYNVYRVNVVLQGPADNQFVNTWHFATANTQEIDETPDGILEGNKLLNGVTEFYNSWSADALAPGVAQAGTTVKIYNVTDPLPPHPPRYVYTYNTNPWIADTDGEPLPWECCSCLSFQGFLQPGGALTGPSSRARRRGRVYLGPLTSSASEWDVTGYVRVAPAFRAAVLDAYKTMVDDLLADGYESGMYSTADGNFINTATAWIDDAYDTQRRRGQDPVARTSVDRLVDNTAWA